MRVGIFQIDGKMPNLALMKLAAYHQIAGDEVILNDTDVERAYLSVVFPHNRPKIYSILKKLRGKQRFVGGTGVSTKVCLPDEIEHTMPAYEMWDVDYAMGFTSRGCVRNCEFCYVPRKEGMIREHSKLSEFVGSEHKKVILLDNNLLAAPNAKEVLRELVERKIKVNFSQGLDIRLVDEENASLLARTKYTNWKFTAKQIHFAFDDISYEKQLRRGIEFLIGAGIKPQYMMCYILVDFNTTFEEDMYRYNLLWKEYGVYPYIQIFNRDNRPRNRKIQHFARWVNKRVHKVCDFEIYDPWVKEQKQNWSE